MSRIYLDVPFAQKDQAKGLGARFDWDAKRWYVQDGLDVQLFRQWLPAGSALSQSATTQQLALGQSSTAVQQPGAGEGPLAQPAGISLSSLLRGVSAAIAQAYQQPVWVVVEIIEARVQRHVYLEVSERDDQGRPLAKARALIWEGVAGKILPAFEKATGVVLGAGIKLLVLAQPTMHEQYGFSLQIQAIDAQYTLGYLEARRREIRARLQREGVYANNRQLPAPWGFELVLVVAPADGAGLGDFHQEARRLQAFGLCRFVYVHSRFQGEGAAAGIAVALRQELAALGTHQPDAVVIIRGGGAVSDLAWLDDYDLCRFICTLPIPVFAGIGHARDHTLVDEVAHTRFDTPSKVIAGIEQRIVEQARAAREFARRVFGLALDALQRTRAQSEAAYARIGSGAMGQVYLARQRLPASFVQLSDAARLALGRARSGAQLNTQAVLAQAQALRRQAGGNLDATLRRLLELAWDSLYSSKNASQALFYEIIGQGPDKTLARGFAVVRAANGKPIGSCTGLEPMQQLDLEFQDGHVRAQVQSVQLKDKHE